MFWNLFILSHYIFRASFVYRCFFRQFFPFLSSSFFFFLVFFVFLLRSQSFCLSFLISFNSFCVLLPLLPFLFFRFSLSQFPRFPFSRFSFPFFLVLLFSAVSPLPLSLPFQTFIFYARKSNTYTYLSLEIENRKFHTCGRGRVITLSTDNKKGVSTCLTLVIGAHSC